MHWRMARKSEGSRGSISFEVARGLAIGRATRSIPSEAAASRHSTCGFIQPGGNEPYRGPGVYAPAPGDARVAQFDPQHRSLQRHDRLLTQVVRRNLKCIRQLVLSARRRALG